jgi:hypothetical protein
MAKQRAKSDLPQKICLTCGRPFAWRKKWARDWDQVRYCSDRCRQHKRAANPENPRNDHKQASS